MSDSSSVPLRLVTDNLSVSVMLFDASLTLVYMNPSAEMLLEASARQLLGTRVCDMLRCAEGSLESAMRRALEAGQSYTERAARVPLPDGRTLTADCTVTPVGGLGVPVSLLIELKVLDRQMQIIREEHLLSQQQATHEMVRGLSHEIKNPLGGLRGAAQLLDAELSDDNLREYTRVIMAEADRLRNLVDRMPGLRQRVDKVMMNVHEITERVRLLVQAEQGDAIMVYTDYDPSIPDFLADPNQLVQAILNVARNAAQAVGENGMVILRTRIKRSITIGHIHHRLICAITVVDNGPGIEPDMAEKIFLPMITGRADGTGLGLPIAQSIISMHDGIIECGCNEGRTEFSILLPMEFLN